MKGERKCWQDGNQCVCGQEDRCPAFLERFSKIVYCKDVKCIWNFQVNFKKHVELTKDHIPLGEDDLYTGVCARKEIALSSEEINTLYRKHVLASCRARSVKSLGHLDFTKFPHGGNIPDPVTTEAYGITR